METKRLTEFIELKHVALVLIFLLGLFAGLFPINTGYHYWDETVYLQHGEILAGESPNNFNEFQIRPPLFSLLLGGTFAINHSLISAHVMVALLSATGILLTFILGRDLFDSKIGLGAAFIYSLSPIRIKMAGDIMVDALLPVLWLLTVIIFYRAINSPENRQRSLLYFSTGISAGLAVLMKFTSLVIIPILGLALLAYKWFEGFKHPKDIFYDLILDKDNYIAVLGFTAAVTPYLFWSKITYGGFFSTFIHAWSDRGLTDPFMVYLSSLDILLPSIFFAGVLIYVLNLGVSEKFENLLPLGVPGFFYLVMQFIIRNKEPRFLLPAIPFVAVLASRGLKDVLTDNRFYIFLVLSAVLILPTVSDEMGESVSQHGLTHSPENYPEAEAAIWMRENTPEDAVLYTNFHEPILGYYSKRNVVQLPNYQDFETQLEEYFDQPGYVYYANTTRFRHPSYEEMAERPDFSKVKSFEGQSYLFYFSG